MTTIIDWIIIAIHTVLMGYENALFACSLYKRKNWTAIEKAANRKCIAAARLLQKEKGGRLVYMVAKDWPEGMICDHFMNEVDGKIVDRYGHTAVEVSPGYYDFGHGGPHYLVAVVESFEDLDINGIRDLFKRDIDIHNQINR